MKSGKAAGPLHGRPMIATLQQSRIARGPKGSVTWPMVGGVDAAGTWRRCCRKGRCRRVAAA
eukprot:11863574-Alexandrium_andersonii.AAC.1